MGLRSGILPSKRLFWLLGALGLLALGCFYSRWFFVAWLALLGLLAMLILLDAIWLHHAYFKQLSTQWDVHPTAGQPFILRLNLQNVSRYPIRWSIEPVQSDIFKSPGNLEIDVNGAAAAVSIGLTPLQRGDLSWPGLLISLSSSAGLLEKWQQLPSVPIPVYPRLLTNRQQHLNPELLMQQLGLKVNRNLRSDQEFESLRPYVVGDNYRHIDWKASSRMQTLITRQYQVEHHHNVLVCIDSSRLMGTLTEGATKLDWAIEATLHLAWLAARFQDRIGLVVFSDRVHQWIKPRTNPTEVFLNALYPLKCSVVEADLYATCLSILAHEKKRSLVIFLSDFMDAASLEPSLPVFSRLNRKHCTVFMGVEDPAYHRLLCAPSGENAMQLSQYLVAQDAVRRREKILEQLRGLGLQAGSARPENLVQQVMDAYLEIKFSGRI